MLNIVGSPTTVTGSCYGFFVLIRVSLSSLAPFLGVKGGPKLRCLIRFFLIRTLFFPEITR